MVICFTNYLLGKKHKLSKVWLAAHWEKKIKKTQIFDIDVEKSVHEIMEEEIILDLRISGHLLVGIVRIHSRKTKYLLTDCSNVFYEVKIFQAGRIDLPESMQTATVKEITLTEFFNDNFGDFGNDVLESVFVTNQSRAEDITLKETNASLTLFDENDMMDFEFHEENELVDIGNFLNMNGVDIVKDLMTEKRAPNDQNEDALFDQPQHLIGSRKGKEKLDKTPVYNAESLNLENEVTEIPESIEVNYLMNGDIDHSSSNNSDFPQRVTGNRTSEKLDLDPLNFTQNNNAKCSKSRKRKLCKDYKMCLSEEDLEKQVLDTSDITSIPDIAPSSKRLMNLKETGCAQTLLCLAAIKLLNFKLLKLYQRNLNTRPSNDFDPPSIEEENSAKNCRFDQVYSQRKTSESALIAVSTSNRSLSENSDETVPPETRYDTNRNAENDFPLVDENFVNTDLEDPFPEKVGNNLCQESTFFDKFRLSDDFKECTQGSKTSQERWEYALQGRITQILQYLRLLFKERSLINFSSLTQNERRLKVAQKFFCLLMLQKFQVITMKQCEAYGEIVISKGSNFEIASSQFASP